MVESPSRDGVTLCGIGTHRAWNTRRVRQGRTDVHGGGRAAGDALVVGDGGVDLAA